MVSLQAYVTVPGVENKGDFLMSMQLPKAFPQLCRNGDQIQVSFSPKIPNKVNFIPETMYSTSDHH